MSAAAVEVKPCPCGGSAELMFSPKGEGRYLYALVCRRCRKGSAPWPTTGEALAHWNQAYERDEDGLRHARADAERDGILPAPESARQVWLHEMTCDVCGASTYRAKPLPRRPTCTSCRKARIQGKKVARRTGFEDWMVGEG